MKWTPLLLVALALMPAVASAAEPTPQVRVEMTQDSYGVVGALTSSPPTAVVTVLDAGGEPVPDVAVRVAFVRQTAAGYVGNETVMARTGPDGTARVAGGLVSGAPGNYVVVAFALGQVGSDRYAVGL